ncbi:glycosyltransferase family 2 protein [Mongoliimonas terrestris]|uniref:glycosyltransferase family 2 protein n=1 Tax=Mongoliimonas terrestris TaxID=1709001 RepID=UPI0009499A2A|nr:glycosyltransferase family A protein [Mongoliimonas terrestris]
MQYSVILPVYNGVSTIAVQLDSLAQQNWTDGCEVLVVDNGCTDRSMDIVGEYVDKLPNLRIVQAFDGTGPRQGVDHSYRTGFAAARGECLLLCEADDELADDWFAAMSEALRHHDFVVAALDPVPLNRPDLARAFTVQQTGLMVGTGPLWTLPWGFGCAIGFRRAVYDAIGGPAHDCGTSWDIDYCWRAQRAGFQLHFEPKAKVHYRLRDSGTARYNQGVAWGRSEALLQKKYGHRSRVRYLARESRRFAACLTRAALIVMGQITYEAWLFEFGLHVGRLRGFTLL